MPRTLGIYKTRRLAFPAESVYQRWIDPSVRVPPIVSMQADVRVGGAVQIVIETGGRQSTMQGSYTKVEPGQRLQYTWQWQQSPAQTLVTVEFHPQGDACRLTLTHEGFEQPADREAHELAWNAYLQQLERELAQRDRVIRNQERPAASPS